MAVFSTLRTFPTFQLISRITRNAAQKGRAFHEGEFPMRPTTFHWRKFKDFLHFYTLLGVIPLALITTYVNIVVGPAELAEIPEGYEPKHWEYYKSPISRFMARYMIRDKRIDYEGMVHYINEESEKIILKNVERMVKDFMKYKNDYQSWYYRPVEGHHFRFEREEWKYFRDNLIGQKSYVADENLFSDGGNPK